MPFDQPKDIRYPYIIKGTIKIQVREILFSYLTHYLQRKNIAVYETVLNEKSRDRLVTELVFELSIMYFLLFY